MQEILAPRSKLKMVELFIRNPEESFNPTEIAEEADIGRDSVYDHLSPLLNKGLVIKADKEGNSIYYTADQQSILFRLLKSVDEILSEQ